MTKEPSSDHDLCECRTAGRGELLGLYRVGDYWRWLLAYQDPDTLIVTVYDVEHGHTCLNEEEWHDWCALYDAQRVHMPEADRKMFQFADEVQVAGADELVKNALRAITRRKIRRLAPKNTIRPTREYSAYHGREGRHA